MRKLVLALLKIKPQPNPAESSSAFFMPVNTLFFQNLRENEKIRKSVLHALIERWKLSLELGRKLKGQVGDKTLTPTCRHTPYGINAKKHIPFKQRSRTI